MIEMLGVLAIIGVLSLGGIVAYRQAITRHRTNQLLNLISMVTMESKNIQDNSSLDTSFTAEFLCVQGGLDSEFCQKAYAGATNTRKCRSLPFGENNSQHYWCVYNTPTSMYWLNYIVLIGLTDNICQELVAKINFEGNTQTFVGTEVFDAPYNREGMKKACLNRPHSGWGGKALLFYFKR